MRTIRNIIILILAGCFMGSCKKSNIIVPTVALNVINASPGVSTAYVKTPTTGYFSQLLGIGAGASYQFTLSPGNPNIQVAATDTIKLLYSNNSLNAPAGAAYSLFIGGSAGEEIFLHRDTIPYRTDSSFGVRFVNMSQGSDPVNVNIQGNANGSEITGLGYKDISPFRSYAATSDFINTGYTFEFRAADGTLLNTYSTSNTFYGPLVPIYYNITLVIYGPPGSQQVMETNNF